MVLESNKSKTKTTLEDVLRGIVTGLLANCLFTPTVAMVFCHELLNESTELEKSDEPIVPEKLKRPDIYEIPAAPKRDKLKPKAGKLSDNSQMLRQLPLQLLTTLLKRKKISVAEHSGLLDPLISSLTSLLSSPAVRTQVLVVKCFSQLFEQSVLLPSLCHSVPELTKFSFEILRNNSRSTNSGHMLELIFSSFKILTVILREYKDFSLTEVQTQTLLQYIADDIHNRNRQSTAFSLLKSILSRDLIHPEIPDLLSRVLEMSIVGQSHFVRTQSRQVYLHYLLHYPLGKKLRPLFISLTQQLEYTHKDGRLSALELIHALISKLPPDLLKEYFLVFFLSLSRMLVADDEVECRRAVGVTLQDLMVRGDDGLREKVWSMTSAWLSDSKTKHRYLAVQLVDILSDHVSEKKGAQFTEQLARLVSTYSSSSDDTTATTLRDQVLYRSVVTLLKFKQPPTSLYNSLEALLLYPHQWVRLAGSQLLGHLLSMEDAASFQPSTVLPADKVTALIQCCVKQLHSQNILPDHALQLTKNFVWFTSVVLRNPHLMPPSNLIHKLITSANVEASQNPGCVVKRGMVLKWVGALAASLPPDLILPYLPTLVVPINRELKTSTGKILLSFSLKPRNNNNAATRCESYRIYSP